MYLCFKKLITMLQPYLFKRVVMSTWDHLAIMSLFQEVAMTNLLCL